MAVQMKALGTLLMIVVVASHYKAAAQPVTTLPTGRYTFYSNGGYTGKINILSFNPSSGKFTGTIANSGSTVTQSISGFLTVTADKLAASLVFSRPAIGQYFHVVGLRRAGDNKIVFTGTFTEPADYPGEYGIYFVKD